MGVHTLSLRIPSEIHERVGAIARRRNVSFTQFVLTELERAAREDMDREMFEAAELLADHPEECDVEFAREAQAELALKVRYDAE